MIHFEQVCLTQGDFSLENIQLRISAGSYAVLMGNSGSGKTTLIEMLCGLRRPDSGRILIGGEDMTNATPAAREIGYVPQDGALFKTMSVRDQLAFALEIRNRPEDEIEERVREVANLLEISHLLDRSTVGLSGGERQRTALGRALSFRPKVLLLDEPLSALDDETHERMMNLLQDVQKQTGVTTLHVTHNRREAEQLATVLLRISDGNIVSTDPQIGTSV